MALTINSTADIAASAEVVWRVLTDFERYGEWNPFVVSCRSTLEPGAPISMRVRLGGRTVAQREFIRSVTPGVGFSYIMKPAPVGALHSLRTHAITPIDAASCRYASHVEIAGWLHPALTMVLGTALRTGFTAMTTALARRAEEVA